MTFLTTEKAEQALSGSNNLLNRLLNPPVVLRDIKLSNHDGTKNITDEVKKDVIVYSFENPAVSNKQVGEVFNISAESVSGIKTGGKDKKESADVKELRETKREEASDVAIDKMMQALGLISADKLDALSAKDLANTAASFSKIAANMRGKEKITDNRTQIVIFSPEQRKESSFHTIDVG